MAQHLECRHFVSCIRNVLPFIAKLLKHHTSSISPVAGDGDYFQFWDIENEIVVFLCKSFGSCPPPFPSGQYPEVEFLRRDVGICLTL